MAARRSTWKTLKEIGLPRQDLGVDLIAQLGDQYHTIQCKYHSEKHQAVTYQKSLHSYLQ